MIEVISQNNSLQDVRMEEKDAITIIGVASSFKWKKHEKQRIIELLQNNFTLEFLEIPVNFLISFANYILLRHK